MSMPNSTAVRKSNRHLGEVPPFDTFRGQNQKSEIKKKKGINTIPKNNMHAKLHFLSFGPFKRSKTSVNLS